jgi:hypothetical protein
MSFLFGKKNKQPPPQQQQQGSALPPATRDIGSSHGQPNPASQIPAPNGAAPRELADKQRSGSGSTHGNSSVNNSLSSLQGAPNPANTASPEPKALRDQGNPDFAVRASLDARCSMLNASHSI